MEFFNFGLEQKLDRHSCHSCVEFHSESDGDGFNFPKPKLNPQNAPLVTPKMEFFNFELEQNLGLHSCEEFHSDSDGDGFKAQTPMIDCLIGLNNN